MVLEAPPDSDIARLVLHGRGMQPAAAPSVWLGSRAAGTIKRHICASQTLFPFRSEQAPPR